MPRCPDASIPSPLLFPVLRIGNVQLATNLLLAPVAGYCDLAWRITCRRLTDTDGKGLGLACTDLLSPQGLLRGTATSLDLAATNSEDSPVGMQLYGGDPAVLAQGALWAAEHGATIVDINMGCPVDKVTKKDGGSRLLCIPDTAHEIVRACKRVLEPLGIPLTCKMRLGWFNDQPVAKFLAPRLVDAGIDAVTIHGRTTEQKFSGEVSLDGIARVVEAVGGRVPVIGNGDVRSPEDCRRMLHTTGCAGVMIGRASFSQPWLFAHCWRLLRTGELLPEPTDAEKVAIIRTYLDLMVRFRDERYAMMQIRRRISWFGKRLAREVGRQGHPLGCKPLREAVRTAQTPEQVHALLDRFVAGELRGGGYAESDLEGAAGQVGES